MRACDLLLRNLRLRGVIWTTKCCEWMRDAWAEVGLESASFLESQPSEPGWRGVTVVMVMTTTTTTMMIHEKAKDQAEVQQMRLHEHSFRI